MNIFRGRVKRNSLCAAIVSEGQSLDVHAIYQQFRRALRRRIMVGAALAAALDGG